MQTSDSIVIIPTYNEKENIENIIRAVFGLDKCFHILVIEDNSPDGTADIVRRLHNSRDALVVTVPVDAHRDTVCLAPGQVVLPLTVQRQAALSVKVGAAHP